MPQSSLRRARTQRLSSPTPAPETISWAQFESRLDWQQGEHVSLIGPTGCGKSTLAVRLLKRRGYVVAFGTKPHGADPPLDQLREEGWRRIETWKDSRPGEKRLLLWPRFVHPEDMLAQQRAFREAFRLIFVERNWCVYLDEARYLVHTLKLSGYLKLYWQMGRSLGLSLVTTTQRPAHMPLEMYDQATHLFIWRETDRVNLTRLTGISGVTDTYALREVVATLPLHAFLYVNTRTGELVIVNGETMNLAPDPGR